tara:strand:+ start:719 stop:1705 length:987 start_codon:yes stop_codon:yes gene_type:complete
MNYQNPKLFIITNIIIFILLSSCGKVVQQSTSNDKKEPTFSLSLTINDIHLINEKSLKTATNKATSLIHKPNDINTKFTNKNPIMITLKGYKKNKTHNLAWGKSLISTETFTVNTQNKNTQITGQNFLTTTNIKTRYQGKVYDKQKIKVTSAKQSQFEGKFNSKKKQWQFTTNLVKKSYDYYLIMAYSTNTTYQIKTIDQTIISSNKKINLQTDTLDTFRSIIFLNAFRTLEFEHKYYTTINTIFDETFFKSLNYMFPKLNAKELAKKSPIIKVSDPIIDQCIKILELSLIDTIETKAYIKNLNKKYFTQSQKDILINNIDTITINTN